MALLSPLQTRSEKEREKKSAEKKASPTAYLFLVSVFGDRQDTDREKERQENKDKERKVVPSLLRAPRV